MKNFFSKNKAVMLLIVFIVAGFWAYSTFFPRLGVYFEETDELVGENLFEMLSKLRKINLDTDIFSDPDFLTLQDFETEVSAGRAGRENPFSPIGRDTGGVIVEPSYKVLPVSTGEAFFDIDGNPVDQSLSTTTPEGV